MMQVRWTSASAVTIIALLSSITQTAEVLAWPSAITNHRGHYAQAGRRSLFSVDAEGSRTALAPDAITASAPITMLAELTASDGSRNAEFGWAVGVSGDGSIAIVGAYGAAGQTSNTGATYIFVRTESVWTQQQKLTASDGVYGGQFGSAVAMSADGATVVIGAIGQRNGAGAAYVFTRNGTTWSQQAELVASDSATGSQFGFSVAVDANGTTAIVGADAANGGAGTAYVFTRRGSSWSQQSELKASDSAFGSGAQFGASVAVSADGNTAIIGEPGRNEGAGAGYIFGRSGATWTQQTDLLMQGSTRGDNAGLSVAMSDDGKIVLMGADGRHRATGIAAIFTFSGTTWVQTAQISAKDGTVGDNFGIAVALNGTGAEALVGANNRLHAVGAAYLFKQVGAAWSQQAELTATDAVTNAQLGGAVALSDDGTISIAGANGKNRYTGAAYVFGTQTTRTATVTVSAPTIWVSTGISVTTGTQLSITATGSWTPGSIGFVGPDGYSQPWPDNFLNLKDIGVCASCATDPAPYWAALIGYIGTAPPPPPGSYVSSSILPEAERVFPVGSSAITTTVLSGALWLGFNDDAYSGNTSDNAGQVVAQVTAIGTASIEPMPLQPDTLPPLPRAVDPTPQVSRGARKDKSLGSRRSS